MLFFCACSVSICKPVTPECTSKSLACFSRRSTDSEEFNEEERQQVARLVQRRLTLNEEGEEMTDEEMESGKIFPNDVIPLNGNLWLLYVYNFIKSLIINLQVETGINMCLFLRT